VPKRQKRLDRGRGHKVGGEDQEWFPAGSTAVLTWLGER